jgi:hypothetical protein
MLDLESSFPPQGISPGEAGQRDAGLARRRHMLGGLRRSLARQLRWPRSRRMKQVFAPGHWSCPPAKRAKRRRLAKRLGGLRRSFASDPNRGHLLFVQDQTLMAQPFDARSLQLSREPVVVAERVADGEHGVAFVAEPGPSVWTRDVGRGRPVCLCARGRASSSGDAVWGVLTASEVPARLGTRAGSCGRNLAGFFPKETNLGSHPGSPVNFHHGVLDPVRASA